MKSQQERSSESGVADGVGGPGSVLLLPAVPRGTMVTVVGVDGDDALAHHLESCGLWPGVTIERLATAPFGDPLLFRLHGFRLALRVAEAMRVRVESPR